MASKSRKLTAILGLGLGIALLLGGGAMGAMPQRTVVVKRTAQVAVPLDRKSEATRARIEREIKRQLGERGISATDKEVDAATRQALDLIAKSKDPEKGVIYIKTKKFTFCASWGNDKTFCKAPPS